MRFSDLALKNKLFKLSSWKLLEPFFNVQHFFEFDLAQVNRLSLANAKLPPGGIIRIFRGANEIDTICENLKRADVSPLVIRHRLERGDMIAMVLCDAELAAYTWVTFSEVWVSEIHRKLTLNRGEAVQFDTLVMPSWRGKGLQYAVTVPILQRLADEGCRLTLAWVNAFNRRSIKNQLRQGKHRIATLVSFPLFGIVWPYETSPGTSLKLLKREPGRLA